MEEFPETLLVSFHKDTIPSIKNHVVLRLQECTDVLITPLPGESCTQEPLYYCARSSGGPAQINFTSIQKADIIYNRLLTVLCNAETCRVCSVAVDLSPFLDTPLLPVCQRFGITDCIFPLHNPAILQNLWRKWLRSGFILAFPLGLPLSALATYFGEETCSYFRLAQLQIAWLLGPSAAGVLVWAYWRQVGWKYIYIYI
jgi:hypothetical protein